MSPKYESLPRDGKTIRLLRLRPSIDKAAPIRSELFEYSLGIAGESHRYEALSYVWGDPGVTRTITVDEAEFRVTVNLFAALQRLRNALLDRLLWIDAICINQDDIPEKENQIPLMRMIYRSAGKVIVWLGAEAEKSDGALKFIRLMAEVREDGIEGYDDVYNSEEESSTGDDDYDDAGDNGECGENDVSDVDKKARYTIVLAPPKPERPVQSEDDYQAVLELLWRPWFRRIWVRINLDLPFFGRGTNFGISQVLQEVGVARSIQIMCGPIQMDGYVFSTGVGNSGISFSDDPGLKAVASSVVSLMKSAIFRPPYTPATTSGLPLVDLLNMYHKREATQRHDKVYALLGLCNEDLEASGLLPDYSISWSELLSRLIRHVFGTEVQVDTRQGIAFITGKGYVFGHVSSTHRDRTHKERQYVKVGHNTIGKSMGLKLDFSVGMPAVSIERNDIVCCIGGSSRLWVIRRVEDYFTIITNVPGLEGFWAQVQANHHMNPLLWGKLYLRDLFLAWDLSPGHDSTVTLTGDDGVLRFHGPKHALAKHHHAMALVSSDGERVVKEKEPHAVNEGIRKLELAFGKTHDETLAARRDLALLYVTRRELKKAEDTMRGIIKCKARAKSRSYLRSILDSTTTLATIFMFYSSLTHSSTGPGRPPKLYSEPWEVTRQFVGILKKIRRGHKFAKEDVMSALKFIEGDGLTGLLKLFFSRSNRHELITEDVVKTVAGSVENRREVMRFLLNQLGDDLPISEDVMKEVVKDNKYGIEMLELLISRRGKDLPLSEGVVLLAAGSQLQPHSKIIYKKNRIPQVETIEIPVVQILDLLESRGDSLPITEDILMEAARNERGCLMMQDFARRLGPSYIIPEVILVTAINNWSGDYVEGLTTLISRQWNASSIPECILLAAAKHHFDSTDLLRGLFDKAGHDLLITMNVLIATVTNSFRFNDTDNLILIGEKQQDIVIPEEVMAAVIDSFNGIFCEAPAIGMINLLLEHTSFVLSEQAVERLLDEIYLPRDDELMSIIFESRENLRVSQRLQDRICDLERLRTGLGQ